MDGPSIYQDSHYRRGVVLGLTIGEAILLLLFSLLLVLAVPLIQQGERSKELALEIERTRKEREAAAAALSVAESRIASLSEAIRVIQNAAPGKGIEDLSKEYVFMREQIRQLTDRLSVAETSAEAFKALAYAARADARPEPEAIKRLASEIAANKAIAETVAQALGKHIPPEKAAEAQQAIKDLAMNAAKAELAGLRQNELVERAAKAEASLTQTKLQLSDATGQLANAKRQLAQGGKGVQAVPCWATPEGSPEYIFDVALTSNGLIVRDRKLPHRKDQQAALPISEFLFDTEVTPERFQAMARRLFEWSVLNECRYFVRAFDNTALTEKMRYKANLQSVGSRFYYREILDEQF